MVKARSADIRIDVRPQDGHNLAEERLDRTRGAEAEQSIWRLRRRPTACATVLSSYGLDVTDRPSNIWASAKRLGDSRWIPRLVRQGINGEGLTPSAQVAQPGITCMSVTSWARANLVLRTQPRGQAINFASGKDTR